jgi:hypothetical protein
MAEDFEVEPPIVFHLRCGTDNASFLPDAGRELARILRDVADRLESEDLPRYAPGMSSTHRDGNGNTVLEWSWGPEPDAAL